MSVIYTPKVNITIIMATEDTEATEAMVTDVK